MKEITLPAIIDNIPKVTAFIDEQLESLDCPMKAQMQIDVAVDEIFCNIATYAYASGEATPDASESVFGEAASGASESAFGEAVSGAKAADSESVAVGEATVRFSFEETSRLVSISFIDRGVPFDPLKKDDPNVALSLEERQIGGLGIFLVKKSMDHMAYRYENGQNILTIQKKI